MGRWTVAISGPFAPKPRRSSSGIASRTTASSRRARRPRRVIDAGYDAAASPGWAVLMTLVALAGRVMAAGLLAYAGALAAAWLRSRTREREIPVAAAPSPVGPTTPATAWSGPLTMLVLLVGMYAATAIAFELTQALPIAAVGAAGH